MMFQRTETEKRIFELQEKILNILFREPLLKVMIPFAAMHQFPFRVILKNYSGCKKLHMRSATKPVSHLSTKQKSIVMLT